MMQKKVDVTVPKELILANELQKIGDYELSRKTYQDFFDANPMHILRFKALFEVADNLYHAGRYVEARQGYLKFLEYCASQEDLSADESGWVEAYTDLSNSRLRTIKKGL